MTVVVHLVDFMVEEGLNKNALKFTRISSQVESDH